MIEIIGAPFDLCGLQPGSRLGPAALRIAGLQEALENAGLSVVDSGDVVVRDTKLSESDSMRALTPLLAVVADLQTMVGECLDRGNFPIIMGGEHTMVVGAISAWLQRSKSDLGVLWIDAHGDINTPGTSVTGNIHGMPLAALAGMSSGTIDARDKDWHRLLSALGEPKLPLQNVAWFGLRDVDERERRPLRQGLPISMHEIDRYGIEETINRIDAFYRRNSVKQLWISFDVDALDPILAPGTGTAVRGGLSYREAHLMAELLYEKLQAEDCPYELAGVDIVETNPLTDNNNQTSIMAVEWIASLFGKTILGR